MLQALTIYDLRFITGLAVSGDKDPDLGIPTLKEAVAELSLEAQRELCALMYFGRGDFGHDFELALQHARSLNAAAVARTIAEKALSLPIYLVMGLGILAGDSVVPQVDD